MRIPGLSHLQRLLNRRAHYRNTFRPDNPSAQFVLADLRRFAKAGQPALVVGSNGQTDVYATGMMAGRQEMFWRIAHHLHLDDSQLLELKEDLDVSE
jgi:hypothetical protein